MTDPVAHPPQLALLPGRALAAGVPRPARHLRAVDAAAPAARRPRTGALTVPSHAGPVPPAQAHWARLVGDLAGRSLGTDFTPLATRLAVTAQRLLPDRLSRGHSEVWAAALVFVLAEHTCLFDYDAHVSRSGFARELGSTLPTLRRRAALLHPVLAAHLPTIPEPRA